MSDPVTIVTGRGRLLSSADPVLAKENGSDIAYTYPIVWGSASWSPLADTSRDVSIPVFVPVWRDFQRFAILRDGYLYRNGSADEAIAAVRELLDRRRTAGALPLHQDDLFTLHATLFVLQRTLKWNDGIRVRDMADASMVIAEIRNRLLALAPRSESVRRRPEGRHASWPQPKLEPGDPVEVDLVVGIDPLVVREFHADTDEADVPWIPAMDSMASESDGDTDLTYEPAPSFPPRRDGLTTLLQLLPGKAYEILVPLPRNVAVDTRYAVRLSDELLRCGIILESAMPDGFGRGTGEGAPSAWRVIVRSRRKSTVVSVSAGAILANVGVIYDPADD